MTNDDGVLASLDMLLAEAATGKWGPLNTLCTTTAPPWRQIELSERPLAPLAAGSLPPPRSLVSIPWRCSASLPRWCPGPPSPTALLSGSLNVDAMVVFMVMDLVDGKMIPTCV